MQGNAEAQVGRKAELRPADAPHPVGELEGEAAGAADVAEDEVEGVSPRGLGFRRGGPGLQEAAGHAHEPGHEGGDLLLFEPAVACDIREEKGFDLLRLAGRLGRPAAGRPGSLAARADDLGLEALRAPVSHERAGPSRARLSFPVPHRHGLHLGVQRRGLQARQAVGQEVRVDITEAAWRLAALVGDIDAHRLPQDRIETPSPTGSGGVDALAAELMRIAGQDDVDLAAALQHRLDEENVGAGSRRGKAEPGIERLEAAGDLGADRSLGRMGEPGPVAGGGIDAVAGERDHGRDSEPALQAGCILAQAAQDQPGLTPRRAKIGIAPARQPGRPVIPELGLAVVAEDQIAFPDRGGEPVVLGPGPATREPEATVQDLPRQSAGPVVPAELQSQGRGVDSRVVAALLPI